MKTVSHNAYDYLEIDKISLKQTKPKIGFKALSCLCLISVGALIITRIYKKIKK